LEPRKPHQLPYGVRRCISDVL